MFKNKPPSRAAGAQPPLHHKFAQVEVPSSLNHNPAPEWVDKLVALVAEEFLPLTLADKPAFREFVTALNSRAQCPSHKGIKSRMEEMRVDLQEQLGVFLKDEWVTIASDGWTSRSRDTYLRVTYHFIDSEWVLRSVTVDCEKLQGSTTSKELTYKVSAASGKRNVAGVVANVTDCEFHGENGEDGERARHSPLWLRRAST